MKNIILPQVDSYRQKFIDINTQWVKEHCHLFPRLPMKLDISVGKFRLQTVPRNNPLPLSIGLYNNDCMWIRMDTGNGGGASMCAVNAQLHPKACLNIITRDNKLIAQSWTYFWGKKTVVFDNIELGRNRYLRETDIHKVVKLYNLSFQVLQKRGINACIIGQHACTQSKLIISFINNAQFSNINIRHHQFPFSKLMGIYPWYDTLFSDWVPQYISWRKLEFDCRGYMYTDAKYNVLYKEI